MKTSSGVYLRKVLTASAESFGCVHSCSQWKSSFSL